MKKGWLLLGLILLNGCVDFNISSDVECAENSDCVSAGCSSQICAPVDQALDIITTCEYLEEYECLKLTSCGCVNNKCQWEETQEYEECLEEVGA